MLKISLVNDLYNLQLVYGFNQRLEELPPNISTIDAYRPDGKYHLIPFYHPFISYVTLFLFLSTIYTFLHISLKDKLISCLHYFFLKMDDFLKNCV